MTDKTHLLDANILIRYFTNDDPKKAERCEALFKKVAAGKEKILLNHLTIAEVVWVLESAYTFGKDAIVDSLLRVFNTPNIVIPDADLILTTFSVWRLSGYKIDYMDAYNAAWIITNDLPGIYSYDRDFDKIDISRKEP
ncbi:MAG: PIN domain-containing protein [Bacteroidetes bacterium]|nr:PIN domain-containing protein [Candidatus Omnitrophota bacterium]MBU1128727.1 PIN domain-containing protein [Candidatus Omnitrophota bacterium]MBU1800608.1 PIN domain-containing protein [Bacteroidota bacterium]